MSVVVGAERMVAGGEALCRLDEGRPDDGRIVFVGGLLPGERAVVSAPERRRGADRADVVEISERAPERVDPSCPQRLAGCGGCDWLHASPDAQLAFKTEVVLDALRRVGGFEGPVVAGSAAVPPAAYRTTIRVVGGPDGRPGYRRERSHEVVAAPTCPVAHPAIESLLPGLRVATGVELVLRCSVATGERTARWRGDAGLVRGLPDDVRTGRDASLTEVIGHGPTARDATGSTTLVSSAAAFAQTGPWAAGLLVDAVARAAPELDEAGHVADLYGGSGLFAASVVRTDALVTLVESGRAAVRDAATNVPAARIVHRDVEHWDPRPDRRAGVPPVDVPVDVVVADPPRTGLGPAAVEVVARAGAATVVLVSCDPVAAARDGRLLADHGFVHDGVEVLDLFPGTHHVETVTRFVRRRDRHEGRR